MKKENEKVYKNNIGAIDWNCPPSYFWACLIFPIFVGFMSICVFNESKGFFAYSLIFVFIPIIIILRMPKRIRIDGDILSISWIMCTRKIEKESIKSIIRKKQKYNPGQWYYFRISLNKPFSVKYISETFPMLVPYEIKPYYNLEPAKIYDIVEEIDNWYKTNITES